MTVSIQRYPSLSFRYGGVRIRFERLPRNSSKNRILIRVQPDCLIQVRAPESATDKEVISAVKKRASWISEKLREFHVASEHTTEKQYVSGESHFYLGRRHLLKVLPADEGREEVKLLRGRFDVHTKSRNADHIRELMLTWYREKAREIFQQRLDAVAEQALWLSEVPPLTIRTMQTQWGSCSPSGRLTLNLHLVKAPRDCIEYVILHELCHLAEHNHSKRFYRLINQVMPNWEEVKVMLDTRAAELLSY